MSRSIPPRSPCVQVCILGADNLCEGCFRSGEEISQWGRMTPDEKQQVLDLCVERERQSGQLLFLTSD